MSKRAAETPAEKLRVWIGDMRVAMFTTLANDGGFHTRPMVTQEPNSAEEIWFFTASHNLLLGEIDSIPQVALSYADPTRKRYVAISGSARVLRDEAKAQELWNPWIGAWFPAGPSDPNLRLVCVTALRAEYWDASTHRMTLLFETPRAVNGSEVKLPHLP